MKRQLLAAHKAFVYSVTMRVHARARCDAHHTMHVAQTHMHAASGFISAEPPASSKWLWLSMARALAVLKRLRVCATLRRHSAHFHTKKEMRTRGRGPACA